MTNTNSRMARKWCITINQDARTFYDNLQLIFIAWPKKIQYICGQLETASTGQLHFQGYIQLKRQQRMSWLINNIKTGGHYEVQRGTNTEARDYCRKEDTSEEEFIEFGRFVKGAGTRTDLASFRDAILSGSTQIKLINTHLKEMARYPKFYNMVRALKRPTRTSDLIVRLNIGDTGLGKTRHVYDNYSASLYVIPITSGTLWFDGYDLQKTALLDDFAGAASKVSLVYTLRLLDRYPQQVAVKGGFTWWMPDLIVITTNIHPRLWYKWENREKQYKALLRRIGQVFYYRSGHTPIRLVGQNRTDFDANDLTNIREPIFPIIEEEEENPSVIDVDITMEDSEIRKAEEIIDDILLTIK